MIISRTNAIRNLKQDIANIFALPADYLLNTSIGSDLHHADVCSAKLRVCRIGGIGVYWLHSQHHCCDTLDIKGQECFV
jgi:hypothetical protein